MNIDKGVKIPKCCNGFSTGKGRPAKYPYRDMEIGDSVFIPNQKLKAGAYASAMKHGRVYGKKFIGRTEGDGLRIWRVK